MAKPVRVQLRRTKGWRMPPNTVKVTRGKGAAGKWGNSFKFGESFDVVDDEGGPVVGRYVCKTAAEAVEHFRGYMEQPNNWDLLADCRKELRGKNLACFCPLDAPCHADVLLELANG